MDKYYWLHVACLIGAIGSAVFIDGFLATGLLIATLWNIREYGV